MFAALFRPEDGGEPVIYTRRRLMREDYFRLFFPDALVARYDGKSKSNLTWFFNGDPRNKSIRRALIAMLREDPRPVIDGVHEKCHAALWGKAGKRTFNPAALRAALGRVRVPGALNAKYRVLEQPGVAGKACRLDAFFEADPSAALARMMLTLAVAPDAPEEAVGRVWLGDGASPLDFMRGDTSPEGRIRYSRMLDLSGRHAEAYDGYEDVARQLDRPARTMDESVMYGRMGEMLFEGEGHYRDEKAGLVYLLLGCLDENPRSYYLYARRAAGQPAREALEKAAALGYAPAIRELGDAWANGNARLGCTRKPETARRCFRMGMAIPDADGAYCAYRLGQLCEAQNDRAAAVGAYRVARENGSAEAAERLARLDWALPSSGVAAEVEPPAPGEAPKYCLTNGLTGCNRAFVEGLRGRWNITACVSATDFAGDVSPLVSLRTSAPDRALAELAQGVYWGGAPVFPELIVALVSDDWRANLRQAVGVLGELQRLAQSLGDRAWDLVDCARVYVLANREDAVPLLDAAFAGMGDMYFQVRLCDPAEDAADQLFAQAPLFLPRLNAPEDAPVRMNLVGGGSAALAILRRAIALPMPAAALSIDVFSEDAPGLRRRFLDACPGLAVPPPGIPLAMPAFHECAPDALGEALRRARTDEASPLARGNYYVVATEDDALNIRLAMRLRQACLKGSAGFDALPFIAVLVRDPAAAWLAGSLPAGGEAAPGKWHGQYDLFPFGALSMYAPNRLREDPVERRARQAYMLFVGLPQTKDARHAAMGGYYRRQHSRQTARHAALSLVYRLHLAGVGLPSWKLYGAADVEARLGADYTRWLEQGDNLQAALRAEHERWCRMMLALGWEPAAPEQVAAYVRRGNPGHALPLARLHPFICGWEALESGERVRAVREAVHLRFPERAVPDPRRSEEASVRDTERLLGLSE